jgi:peptidoglycan hydrolase CwlO-like protein
MGISDARHRAEAIRHQVTDARGVAARLQVRILALSKQITDSQQQLDRAQAHLLVAQRGSLEAQAELDAIRSELDQRARAAFEGLGPGASAVYLLGAGSFADLLDRTVMLDRLQQADVALADDVRARTDRFEAMRARLERRAGERALLLDTIRTRGADLLAAFVEQQAALQQLVDQRIAASRRV